MTLASRRQPPAVTPRAAPASLRGSPDEAQPDPPTSRAGRASSTATPAVATTVPVVMTSTTAVAHGGRPCPSVTAVLQADVDGDGCPDAMRYVDGILESGGMRWSLGQLGDQVATGDWSCQGARTVALFRPSTGEIFRFEGWASPGRDLHASAVARVGGGQILRAADLDRDGCHEAVVERGTGLPVEVIRLPPLRP